MDYQIRYTRVCFFYLLVLASIAASAQAQRSISANYMPGFLLAHRADIKNLDAHNSGYQLNYETDRSESNWCESYKKPHTGFGLLYYNLGQEITGHALGVLTYVKIGIAQKRNTELAFRMGGGLAYLSKKFDVYENRRNQAIGSHLNGSMQFALLGRTYISKNKSYIDYGISISHYSNAAFKVPNLGYNIPSLTLAYGLGLGDAPVSKDASLQEKGKTQWRGTLIFGKKQRNFAQPDDFVNYGIQLRAIRSTSAVKAWRYGLDYTIDKTYKYSVDPTYPQDSISIGEQAELAVAGGFQWTFGRTDVVAEIGAYLYKPEVLKNPLSQRMGVVYRATEHVSLQGTLRFHRGVADFFEFGLGYTL